MTFFQGLGLLFIGLTVMLIAGIIFSIIVSKQQKKDK
tara:strand:+ start:4964 stop:5074 length:111 start_codon:yes stop_codon:yes gene_type:complete